MMILVSSRRGPHEGARDRDTNYYYLSLKIPLRALRTAREIYHCSDAEHKRPDLCVTLLKLRLQWMRLRTDDVLTNMSELCHPIR